MRLADAPEDNAEDAAQIRFPTALLRDDARLIALYAPFVANNVLVSEVLIHDGTAARVTRQLIAEMRGDTFDAVCTTVRAVCIDDFEEKPTELDDVAAGTEWTQRGGTMFVSVYRNFGGSTALHVTLVKTDPVDAAEKALRSSPFAGVAEVLLATSWVEHFSCSRCAREAPRWHLQAALREGHAFTEIAPALTVLGFEVRRGKYWQNQLLVQPLNRGRWLAALPGIDIP